MSGMSDLIAALSDEGTILLHGLSQEQGSRAIRLAGERVMMAMLIGQEAPDAQGYAMPDGTPSSPLTAFRNRLAAENVATEPAVVEAAAHLMVAFLAAAEKRRTARA